MSKNTNFEDFEQDSKKDEFSKRTECKENKNTIKAHMPVKNTNNDTKYE